MSYIRKFKCKRSPDNFCYVCGLYIFKNSLYALTESLKIAFRNYFGFSVTNQDKEWVPHVICQSCKTVLHMWSTGAKRYLAFEVPMLWREPTNHVTDCYICLFEWSGVQNKLSTNIKYANVPSVSKPVPRSGRTVLPSPPSKKRKMETESPHSLPSLPSSGSVFLPDKKELHLTTQAELNDWVRDLKLPKSDAELHASRMKQNGYLAPGVKVTYYRDRSKPFAKYYSKEGNIVFCNDLKKLFDEFGQIYNSQEWRLFIDGSKYSLKAVLLHNGGQKPSIPIAHAVNTKESYESMSELIKLINYKRHNWKVCCDLKVVGFLTGLQGGYTKFCCFLCKWDSRARDQHYLRKTWPVRDNHIVGQDNIKYEALIKKNSVILPPLHIKLGLMKNFVKALKENTDAMEYLAIRFPQLSVAKIKEGVFVGPQIKKLINDPEFTRHLSQNEKLAWKAFKDVVAGFLGNYKQPNYKSLVEKLLKAYKTIGTCILLAKTVF